MRVREIIEAVDTRQHKSTIVFFKGMAAGVQGNQDLVRMARSLNALVVEGTDVARASEYLKSRPGSDLIVVGYSLGAQGVMGMQRYRPKLTITIAGYPTTLERLEQVVQGEYYNFYQQAELDGILRSKYNRGPYRPHAGHPIAVKYDHHQIVGGVSGQVMQLIQSAAGRPARII